MPNELELIRTINQRLLSDIAQRRQETIEQLRELDTKIASIKKTIEQLDYDRSQILAAAKMQENFLQSEAFVGVSTFNTESGGADEVEDDADEQAEGADRGKLKARIGDQRYLVLSYIRDRWASSAQIVDQTGLPAKRVTDVLKTDAELGVITEAYSTGSGQAATYYRLSNVGRDLIERFEAYKRQKGQKLPTKMEVLRDMRLEPPDDDVPPPNSLDDYGVTRTFSAEDRDTVSAANDLLESTKE